MELIELDELSPGQAAELEGDESDPFEVADVTIRFQPKAHHVAVRDDDGTLVASAGTVIADVQVGDERFRVVGLGGVIVRSPFRGRGLAREVVEAAIAREQGHPFALLFCLESRLGLYRRVGFAAIDGDVLVKQPSGYEVMPFRTMWRALRSGVAWPPGQLVLHSLPF